jgi:hypothetical protein
VNAQEEGIMRVGREARRLELVLLYNSTSAINGGKRRFHHAGAVRGIDTAEIVLLVNTQSMADQEFWRSVGGRTMRVGCASEEP